jgi:hypothetical protein
MWANKMFRISQPNTEYKTIYYDHFHDLPLTQDPVMMESFIQTSCRGSILTHKEFHDMVSMKFKGVYSTVNIIFS